MIKKRGGYRPGSGRSKSGYYKGIYCGSTYELCWVIYNIDHNIPFTRFPGKLQLNEMVYYPDFLLDDGKTIVETKGFEREETVSKKTAVAEHYGYTVKVLRKNDLAYAFSYVTEKFNTTKYYELYDGYKRKHTHNCCYCHTAYDSESLIKTSTNFCSRTCAGKYRKTINKNYDVATANIKRKFTKETALEIFNRMDASLQQLANEYGTTKNVIWFIKTKKTYKWIHD
jgi:hypothetical protein